MHQVCENFAAIVKKMDASCLYNLYNKSSYIKLPQVIISANEDQSLRIEIFAIKFTWCFHNKLMFFFTMQIYKELIPTLYFAKHDCGP